MEELNFDIPIRTRTPIGPHPRTRREIGTRPRGEAALVAELRGEARGGPVVVVIHGWGTPSAREFAERIQSVLGPRDAVWQVPARGADSGLPASASEGAVLLQVEPTERADIYSSIEAEIVYFPGRDLTDELGLLLGQPEISDGWPGRARLILVDARGPQSGQLLDAARAAGIEIEDWQPEG